MDCECGREGIGRKVFIIGRRKGRNVRWPRQGAGRSHADVMGRTDGQTDTRPWLLALDWRLAYVVVEGVRREAMFARPMRLPTRCTGYTHSLREHSTTTATPACVC